MSSSLEISTEVQNYSIIQRVMVSSQTKDEVIIDIRDQQLRIALISMGWTPPSQYTSTIWSIPKHIQNRLNE